MHRQEHDRRRDARHLTIQRILQLPSATYTSAASIRGTKHFTNAHRICRTHVAEDSHEKTNLLNYRFADLLHTLAKGRAYRRNRLPYQPHTLCQKHLHASQELTCAPDSIATLHWAH